MISTAIWVLLCAQLIIMFVFLWVNWRILRVTEALLDINNKILDITQQLLLINEKILNVSNHIAGSADETKINLSEMRNAFPKRFREVE